MSGQCAAPGCDRASVARGLCKSHYMRWWQGKPLIRPSVGGPSGYGRWGVMDRGEDYVVCHECGKRYQMLGNHLRSHGMTVRDYRAAHGIPAGVPLTSLRASRTQAERRSRQGDTFGWDDPGKDLHPAPRRPVSPSGEPWRRYDNLIERGGE